MTKALETFYFLVLAAIATVIGNSIGYSVSIKDSSLAMAILIVISFIGYLVSRLPLFNKLPVVLWVSIVATLVSSPIFYYHEEIIKLADKVSLLAICTPVLAYAGLATGKDLAQFKQLSWRIIPISLAVFTGTFIFAALIAQVTLKWDGVIP